MVFEDFLEKDITVHTEYGSKYRGVLKAVNEKLLKFEVGIDTLYIQSDVVYAVTEHGAQQV